MTATAVIALLATQATGAAGGAGVRHLETRGLESVRVYSAPDTNSGENRSALPRACPSVLKALRFYTGRYRHWTQLRGAGPVGESPAVRRGATTSQSGRGRACPRYLLKIRVRKAAAARREWNRYFHYHYVWSDWLPAVWRRLGACETGYGREPGNWTWNSGTYQGAFGFYHGSWDAFVSSADPKAGPYPSEAYNATPRQQWEVALAIWRRYGFSGWGCRGA